MTLPHYANLRDGGNMPRHQTGLGWRGAVTVACLCIIAMSLAFLADPMNAVSDTHPDCYEEAC